MKNILFLGMAFATSLTIMCSCSGKLSREKAKELIIAHEKLPKPILMKFDRRFPLEYYGSDYKNDGIAYNCKDIDFLKGLVNKDLIFIKRKLSYNGLDHIDFVFFTDKGKKYLVEKNSDDESNMNYDLHTNMGDFAFNEITGLVQDENGKKAKVEYTKKIDNITPFGEYFISKQKPENKDVFSKGNTLQRTAFFEKYDDGWRIVDKKEDDK